MVSFHRQSCPIPASYLLCGSRATRMCRQPLVYQYQVCCSGAWFLKWPSAILQTLCVPQPLHLVVCYAQLYNLAARRLGFNIGPTDS